jgi:hypothetical protein
MSTILTDTTIDQTAADEQSLEATDLEAKMIEEYEAAKGRVVDLAVQTLDPKDMLKKHAKLGAETLKLAQKRKGSFKAWEKKDFDLVCEQLDTLVKMRVPIKTVRMHEEVRVYLWVEAVKPLVPSVEKLSYFQVTHKFLPTLSFDAVELTGEIKKEWLTWVRTTVERQLSNEPLSMKELDASIKERKEEIERERLARSKRTPEQILEAEQKAANRKLIAERSAAQSKVSNAVADAISEGKADVNDIVKIVKEVVEQSGQKLPGRLVGLDPETITVDDCKMLAAAMCGAGKIVEMRFLRDRLDAMIKIAENAMIMSKTA